MGVFFFFFFFFFWGGGGFLGNDLEECHGIDQLLILTSDFFFTRSLLLCILQHEIGPFYDS